jgi:hypothetical protein
MLTADLMELAARPMAEAGTERDLQRRFLAGVNNLTPHADAIISHGGDGTRRAFIRHVACEKLAEAGVPSFMHPTDWDEAVAAACEAYREVPADDRGQWLHSMREAGLAANRDPGRAAPDEPTLEDGVMSWAMAKSGLRPRRELFERLRPPTFREALADVGLPVPDRVTTIRHSGGGRGLSEAAQLLTRLAEASGLAPHTIVSRLAANLPPDHPDKPDVMRLLGQGTSLSPDDLDRIRQLAAAHPARLGEATAAATQAPLERGDPCDTCNGTGVIAGMVCPRCDGSGYEPPADQETRSSLSSGKPSTKQGRQRISSDSVVGDRHAQPPGVVENRRTLSDPEMTLAEALREVEQGGPQAASWDEALAGVGLLAR